MHSTSNSENSIFRNRYGLMAAAFSLVLAVFVFAGVVSAAGVAATTSKPVAQATTAPPPNDTVEVPNAAPSGVVPAPIDTTSPTTSGTAAPGQSATGGNSGPATNTTSSDSFPWLLVVLLVVIVALLIIAFVLLRGRRSTVATSTVAAAPVVTAPAASAAVMGTTPAATTATATTTTTTAASAPPTAPAVAPAAVAAANTSPEAAAAGTALPTTLTCPNCSTVNDWSENFCHECGQDLRPLRAGMIAAAAPPPDIVTDDMPYLETLDRADEQLEYVLSRKKIVVGTAPGNDIVIDSAFKGSDTVSPRHAELRREDNGFMLVDLDSENGTYVNDARTGENLLAEGDQIRFGSVRFVYRVPEPSA